MDREPTWAEHRKYWAAFGKYMLLFLLIVVVISLVADNWWAIMRFLDNLPRD